MENLHILRYPDPRLYKKAVMVEEVDDAIRQLVANLSHTMYTARGIGLAATQGDVHKRVIVIDASDTRDQLLVLINPEIVMREGTQYIAEGCLSVPGVYEPVERSARIRVHALDAGGKAFEFEAEKLLAVCIQHEMDHLEGKVFVDYLSRLKRERIRAKMRKLMKLTA
jgi:peptide deformylase